VSVYGSSTLTYLPRSGDQLSSLSLTTQALDPETFRNYEAGVKWDVRPALALGAAVYRLNRGNVAVPDPADPSRSLLVDAQRMQGLEVELRGAVTPAWSLTAGYALQDGEITRSLSASAQAGAVLAQVPRHSLSLWNKYNVSARWAVGLGVVHRTRMFASTDNRVALPGFTRADGAVFFTLSPELLLQVNVENLFDAPYFLNAHNNHNLTPGAPRSPRVSSRRAEFPRTAQRSRRPALEGAGRSINEQTASSTEPRVCIAEWPSYFLHSPHPKFQCVFRDNSWGCGVARAKFHAAHRRRDRSEE
jgi:catecholate siderophore receptor